MAECIRELTQTGTKVRGTLRVHIRRTTPEGFKELRLTSKITGVNRVGIVVLQGLPKDKSTLAFSCGLFKIEARGDTMNGAAVRLNHSSSVFVDSIVIWERMG